MVLPHLYFDDSVNFDTPIFRALGSGRSGGGGGGVLQEQLIGGGAGAYGDIRRSLHLVVQVF